MSRIPPMGRDVRIDQRAQVRVRGVLFTGDPPGGEVEVATVNLSGGGALCDSPVAPALGSIVRLRLDLSNPDGTPLPIVVEALVLRVEGQGPCVVAVHFVNPPMRVGDLIRRFVFRHLPDGSG